MRINSPPAQTAGSTGYWRRPHHELIVDALHTLDPFG